jgi:glutamate/tyrosine decarboxylase-like PLP-dependent enzyme
MDETEIFERLLILIQKYHAGQMTDGFLDYHEPSALKNLLNLDEHEGDSDWDNLFSWVEKYLAFSAKTNHPGFVNRMWAGANLPSIIGEIVVALSNTSSCTYESAPVATLMEKYMLRKMLELVGFSNGEGQMTTGSSNANMIAMMVARNLTGQKVKESGLFSHQELFAFVSADAHYSMDKAANIIGIGTDHLVKVPVNPRGEMDTTELGNRIKQTIDSGGIPFFVGATAGTTVRGAYDPLDQLLELQGKYNFWLHVDGAWGGAVVLSDRLRPKFLHGIEMVDSFTWDFHKMPGTALICNVLLLNKMPTTLGSVCGAGDSSYIFRDGQDAEVHDLGTISLQCGKRVDSLKWFLDWKYYGQTGFAKRIESYLELCQYAEECILQRAELEMVVPRESFNVCFRFKTPPDIPVNDFNLALRTRLYQQGMSLVGFGYIDSKLALRLLITNSSIGKPEIDDFFRKLVATGNELLET